MSRLPVIRFGKCLRWIGDFQGMKNSLFFTFVLILARVAHAELGVGFVDAAVHRYSSEQLEFLSGFVASKKDPKDALTTSLVSSLMHVQSSDVQPPVDFSTVSRDIDLSSAILLDYADSLYRSEQYGHADAILDGMSSAVRQAAGQRYDLLKSRLVLRGFGKSGYTASVGVSEAGAVMNQVLIAIQNGDRVNAIRQLGRLSKDDRLPVNIRHRAALWRMIESAQHGDQANVIDAMDQIDGASPLVAEVMLGIIRTFNDVHPSAASAVEHQLVSRVPDSSARWEVRDYLIRTLITRGSTLQAGERALSAIDTLGRSISDLDKLALALPKMSATELQSVLDVMPEGGRERGAEIVRREAALRKAAEILHTWRPYFDAYQSRLQRNSAKFAEEIRTASDAVRESFQKDAKNQNAAASLFRLELSEVIGSPSNRDMAYRLFFGFAQWEFGYEYPENWRPSFDRTEGEASVRKRGQRDAVQKRDQLDRQMVPLARGHLSKLQEKISKTVGKQSSLVFIGMADRAKELARRNQAQVKEIERILPLLSEALRAEIAQGVKERRQVAQQWLGRFLGHAVSAYVVHKTSGEQLHFNLDHPIELKSGQSVSRSMRSYNDQGKKKPSGELNILPARDLLRKLAVSGDSRQIRANALLLQARLTFALYESQVIESVADAVVIYQTLLRDYAEFIDREEVSYQLARAHDLALDADKSLATLMQFMSDFPASARAGEVWFRIGESRFNSGDFPLAKAAYESVVGRGETPYRDQAEYKLAWSLFKMGDFRSALPRFINVLDRAVARRDGDNLQQERFKDTFRAVSLTFANLGGAMDVERFFAQAGNRHYVNDIYFGIARYYLDHERINDAAEAYVFLIKHAPNDPRAPLLLGDIIAGARKEKLNTLALGLQERFIETYSIVGVYWQQAPEAVRGQIRDRIQPFLSDLGQMYHADAQQTSSLVSYEKAIKYYGQFIATFPKDPQSARFHFLMAEARQEIGQYSLALADFEQAAYHYGAHPDAAGAGYASLVASQKIAQQASDLDERKRKLRDLAVASVRFAGAFPDDSRVDTVFVKAAEDMLMLGEPGEAVVSAEKVLERKVTDSIRRRAWVVVSHGRFEIRDFVRAESAYQKALAESGGTAEEQATLRGRLALSVYRQAESFRDAGSTPQAIDTFLRVGKIAPGTDSVPNAQIDAAVLLIQTRQWDRAIRVLTDFQKTFSAHPLATGIPTRLAYIYEQDGQLLLAAEQLELISKTENDEALSRQMVLRAGELREKDKRMDLAVKTYERYLVRYPSPLEKATEVRQRLADIAREAGDMPTGDRWLNEIISHARDVDASPRVRFLAARAAVTFGDARADEFSSVLLALPLDKSLQAKRMAMEQSLRWYGEAGRFGVAEITTAATYKTAELYRQLAKDVMASARPDGLSDLEVGQYNILLEEEAFPFEEKSAEIHAINHQRIKTGIYDEWVARSMVSLQKLMPAKYDKVELNDGYFNYELPKALKVKKDTVISQPVNAIGIDSGTGSSSISGEQQRGDHASPNR